MSADAEAVLRCLHTAFAPYRQQYTTDGYQGTVLDAETIHHRLSAMSVLVTVTPDADVVGTLSTYLVHANTGHLRGMAVIPAFQGRGVARGLIAAAEQQLYAEGCRRVTLNTTAALQRAMRLYESLGYRRTGHVGEFFGMPLFEYAKELLPEQRSFDNPQTST